MSAMPQVKVWDPLVRLFHWSLVIAFGVAYLMGDEESRVHVLAGYAILGLVGFRVLWGLIGTKYARFTEFLYRPSTLLGYVKDMLRGHPKRYLGHNPLGGVMIIALLVGLFATGLSGIAVQEAEQDAAGLVTRVFAATGNALAKISPVAVATADEDDKGRRGGKSEGALEETHEFFANFTLFLVLLHVAGVLAGSLMHRENLVRAMVTGRKRA